jgi:hypothetical protein
MADLGWNKRAAPRQEVFGQAIILAPGIRASCIVRDLSATGAKLGVSSKIQLPDQFDVLLLKTKSTRRVTLRWRRGDFAGVQFCGSEAAPSDERPAPIIQPRSASSSSGIKSSWRGRE